MIWTFAGLKGGTGKTTLVANLAIEARRRGLRCLLVDLALYPCLRTWASEGGFDGPCLAGLDDETLHELPAMSRGFDLCLVDTQSGDLRRGRALAAISDQVLIPTGASALDVWPLLESLVAFEGSRARPRIIINGHDPRTELGRNVARDLGAQGLPLVPQSVARRSVHAESLAYASGSVEFAPRSRGAAEIVSLFEALSPDRIWIAPSEPAALLH